MIYEIIDSHRNLTKKARKALVDFFCEVKGLRKPDAEQVVGFCDWYEHDYAVSWFEVLSWDGDTVVGYLRCMRDPADVTRWYVGDVHVRKSHWQQGIATQMYAEVFAVLQDFEPAEQVVVAIRRDNTKSIKLHEKCGFADTGKPCEFADFYVAPEENMYRKWLYKCLPPCEAEHAVKFIQPIWNAWKKKQGSYAGAAKEKKNLLRILKEAECSGKAWFETIWCGNRLVGFRMNDGSGEIVFNQQESE